MPFDFDNSVWGGKIKGISLISFILIFTVILVLGSCGVPTDSIPNDIALGEIGGLHYVGSQDFGIENFKTIYIDITIYDELDNNDGIYFQLYQSTINDIGYYFGLQTRVRNPNTNKTGKGLIFSRWGTNDLSNVKTVQGGWSSSGNEAGDYVGIRMFYEWTTHSYRFKLSYIESDSTGDWYGVWVHDLSDSTEDFLGSLRFPSTEPSEEGLARWWTTWTELYSKAKRKTPIPSWHVSIDGFYATEQMIAPQSVYSTYSDIQHTDIYYDPVTKKIHLIMGPQVVRIHPPERLY